MIPKVHGYEDYLKRQDDGFEDVWSRTGNRESGPTSGIRFVPHAYASWCLPTIRTLPRSPILANTGLLLWLTMVADSKHEVVDKPWVLVASQNS